MEKDITKIRQQTHAILAHLRVIIAMIELFAPLVQQDIICCFKITPAMLLVHLVISKKIVIVFRAVLI